MRNNRLTVRRTWGATSGCLHQMYTIQIRCNGFEINTSGAVIRGGTPARLTGWRLGSRMYF